VGARRRKQGLAVEIRGGGGEGGWRYSRDFREGETEGGGGGGGLGGKEAMKTGLFQAAFYLLGLFRSLSL
jgi:hypothetical protein